tara:strand:- start:6060 stop:6332 length:273 start_codon:yes stop_codon:yes gene_type:complete
MFDVNISTEQGKVLGEFVWDSYFFEPSKYEYAFYLYKDGERVDTQWYTDNVKVEFSIKNMVGNFYIKAFIKDRVDENKRQFDSQELLIKN